MKTTIFNIALFILSTLLLFGCKVEDWTYDGPQYYEFSVTKCRQSISGNLIKKENNKIGYDTICVQIVKPTEGNITVNYTIVDKLIYLKDKSKYTVLAPAGTSANLIDTLYSKAVLGSDYEIITEKGQSFSPETKKGSITIPAGECFAYIIVNMKRKAGNDFYISLEDSQDSKANLPTSLFNYKLAPERVFYFIETFDNDIPDTFTQIDKDGDGHIWSYYKGAATSDSYDFDNEVGLFPENYLITPAIEVRNTNDGAFLTFDLSVGKAKYPEEGYKVIISTEPINLANCTSATVLRDWTKLDASYQDYKTEKIDITTYRGKKVYIGIVHGNCSDNYYIKLKNIKVFGE